MATGKSSPLVFLEKNDEAVSITYYSSLRVWLELCVLFTSGCLEHQLHHAYLMRATMVLV